MTSRTAQAFLLLAALAAPLARAQDETPLTSGREVTGNLPEDGRAYKTFTIEVPEGATQLEVVLTAGMDVDLYLKAGAPITNSWKEEATAAADTEAKRERLVLTPAGDPPLMAGTWYVDVVHGERENGKPTRFTLVARVTQGTGEGGAQPMPPQVEAPEDGPAEDFETFSEDVSRELTLTRTYQTFIMEVAPDVASVELSIRGAPQDCDIYVRHEEAMVSWDQADARANGPEADETLVLRRDGAPRLRSGSYYIDVARTGDRPLTLTFAATFTRGYSGPEVEGERPEPSDEANVEGEIRGAALFPVEFGADDPDYHTYTIFVPKGARSLLVTATGADQDVDLYLRHQRPIENYRTDPDHKANAARHDEQLYVDGASTPPLRPGKYYLDIVRAVAEETVKSFEVSVRFDADRPPPIPATPGPVQEIRFNERVTVSLEREERKAARFSFAVPATAQRLHVSVFGATRDIDLFLRKGEVITDYDAPDGYDWKAISSRLNERLTIDAQSEPPLGGGGTFFLDVASLVTADAHIRFTILITVDQPPTLAADDLTLPPFQRAQPLTPLERTLQAVVQIEGEHGSGSGTCLTPGGLIVTNYHVLEHEGKLQEEDVFVSFPNAWDEPPEQVLVAKVVAHDEDLDLVLLEPVKDIFDRPLPAGLALPWVPVGDAAQPRLGDVLLIAGYPAVGGDESRSSMSVSRGIISGFNTDGRRRTWIKTDATINSGNSGGSAFWQDAQGGYHYVGVPTYKLYEEGGALGFCRPTSCLPTEWVQRVQQALSRQQR
jgi:S1-C subfamily serine protease